jgi:hypothetical protein
MELGPPLPNNTEKSSILKMYRLNVLLYVTATFSDEQYLPHYFNSSNGV